MDEDKKDNLSVASSSLASIIRRSLNQPFRTECHLLLGATNNRDVEDAIRCMLKGEKTKKILDATPQLPLCQSIAISDVHNNSHSNEKKQNRDEIVEAICVKSSQDSLGSRLTSCIESSSSASLMLCNTQKQTNLDSMAPTDIPSDEETQLDWDILPNSTEIQLLKDQQQEW